MNRLNDLQRTVAKALTVLVVAGIPTQSFAAFALDRSAGSAALIAAALAAAPVVALLLHRPLIVVAFALVVALVGQTSLLVFTFNGHPWQVEMHFYYFVVLALVSGFCDWRVLVAAAGLIALYHLGVNALLPEAIFPGGSNILRIAIHALAVIVETAMLIVIGQTIRSAFTRAEEAIRKPRWRRPSLSASPRGASRNCRPRQSAPIA